MRTSIGCKNARNIKRIDNEERPLLQPLPDTRTTEYEEELARISLSIIWVMPVSFRSGRPKFAAVGTICSQPDMRFGFGVATRP